jgi:hypothetical protein
MGQTNPRVRSYPINAKGGLMTNIPLTMGCSKVTVIEDPAYNNGAAQGLQGYYIDTQPPQPAIPIEPGGAAPPQADPQYLFTWLPNTAGQTGRAYEPIMFGGSEAGRVHGAFGNTVGAQGTVILQLTTNSANPGGVLVEEWD